MYPTTVAKIEAGERGVRIDEAAAIADLLEVPLDWLLGRRPASERSEIKYAVGGLQEMARTKMLDLAQIAQRLRDWEAETFELSFDGKDGLHADCSGAVHALLEAQMRLARIAGLQLTEAADDEAES